MNQAREAEQKTQPMTTEQFVEMLKEPEVIEAIKHVIGYLHMKRAFNGHRIFCG